MTLHQLLDLASQGEGLHLEFKLKLPEWDKLAREVVAFANTGGGWVLIGVDDDGRVSGLRDGREIQEAVWLNLAQYIHPEVECSVSEIPINAKKSVVAIEVFPSPKRPHRALERPGFSDGNVGQALVRIADCSVKASREMVEIMRFSSQGRSLKVEVGEKEFQLFRYMEDHDFVTIVEFSRLTGLSAKSASNTLVHLVKGGLLSIEPQVTGMDHYVIAPTPAES